MTQKATYQISANGVYRCCKYLKNATFYSDENGWIAENSDMKELSYKNILKMLRQNYKSCEIHSVNYYDGELLWRNFFTRNKCLYDRLKEWKIESIEQLHFYANEKANWR